LEGQGVHDQGGVVPPPKGAEKKGDYRKKVPKKKKSPKTRKEIGQPTLIGNQHADPGQT